MIKVQKHVVAATESQSNRVTQKTVLSTQRTKSGQVHVNRQDVFVAFRGKRQVSAWTSPNAAAMAAGLPLDASALMAEFNARRRIG